MLVDELVDPQSAASCAVAAPYLEHVEALADVVEGQGACRHSVPFSERLWIDAGPMPWIRQYIDRHGDVRGRVVEPCKPDVHRFGFFVETIHGPDDPP